MSAATQEAPTQIPDDLREIEQVEFADTFETEREIWEREAIQELFVDASELFGPDVPQEQLDRRLFNLSSAVHRMSLPVKAQERMQASKELPIVTTQSGVDELLNQVVGLVTVNEGVLESPQLTSWMSSITMAISRMAESGLATNDEMTISEISAILSITEAQRAVRPKMQNYHNKQIFKILEGQFLAQLVLEDPDDPEGMLTPEIHALWEDPDFLEVMSAAVNDAVERVDYQTGHEWSPETWSEVEIKLAQKIFSSLGFDEFGQEKLIDSWTSVSVEREHGLFEAAKVSERPAYIKEQFEAMFKIERLKKGAAKELFHQYGIRNFGRYSAEDLIGQLELTEADLKSSPEIVISAAHDHNTAMEDVSHTKKRLNFEKPIFYEADSVVGMMREMVRASKRFGAIGALLVNGHGKASAFRLGGLDQINKGIVKRSDIHNTEYASKFLERGVLAENCRILLSSCSVGKPGGIAEAIARMTGLTVTGPDDVMYGMFYDSAEGDYDFMRLKGKKHRLHRRNKYEMRDAAVYSE